VISILFLVENLCHFVKCSLRKTWIFFGFLSVISFKEKNSLLFRNWGKKKKNCATDNVFIIIDKVTQNTFNFGLLECSVATCILLCPTVSIYWLPSSWKSSEVYTIFCKFVAISEDFEHHVRTFLVHFSVSSLVYFIVQVKSGEVEFLCTCPTGMPLPWPSSA
jgi:hypothetical protein